VHFTVFFTLSHQNRLKRYILFSIQPQKSATNRKREPDKTKQGQLGVPANFTERVQRRNVIALHRCVALENRTLSQRLRRIAAPKRNTFKNNSWRTWCREERVSHLFDVLRRGKLGVRILVEEFEHVEGDTGVTNTRKEASPCLLPDIIRRRAKLLFLVLTAGRFSRRAGALWKSSAAAEEFSAFLLLTLGLVWYLVRMRLASFFVTLYFITSCANENIFVVVIRILRSFGQR